jgi:hypothetical protein
MYQYLLNETNKNKLDEQQGKNDIKMSDRQRGLIRFLSRALSKSNVIKLTHDQSNKFNEED